MAFVAKQNPSILANSFVTFPHAAPLSFDPGRCWYGRWRRISLHNLFHERLSRFTIDVSLPFAAMLSKKFFVKNTHVYMRSRRTSLCVYIAPITHTIIFLCSITVVFLNIQFISLIELPLISPLTSSIIQRFILRYHSTPGGYKKEDYYHRFEMRCDKLGFTLNRDRISFVFL